MDDDFNTAKSTGHLFDVARAINIMQEPDYRAEPGRAMVMTRLAKTFEEMRGILGFLIADPAAFASAKLERVLREKNITAAEIEDLIRQRVEARAAKDFATGDRIRNDLAAKGIILKDSPQGTTWSVK